MQLSYQLLHGFFHARLLETDLVALEVADALLVNVGEDFLELLDRECVRMVLPDGVNTIPEGRQGGIVQLVTHHFRVRRPGVLHVDGVVFVHLGHH